MRVRVAHMEIRSRMMPSGGETFVHTPSAWRAPWSLTGLVIALLGLPAIAFLFRLVVATTPAAGQLVVRELAMFALLAVLVGIVRRKERLPLSSMGLRTRAVGRSLLWGMAGLLLLGAGLVASVALVHVVGLSYGAGSAAFIAPAWVRLLVFVRAGIVEEAFYRGFAIERLEAMTGSRAIAFVVPLICFAVAHYRQGIAGMFVALMLGAILTGMYAWKRNLLSNIVAHCMIDVLVNLVVA